MKHHKHRKYKILSHQENSTWITDTITGDTQKCFYLNHSIGEDIYLFEKEYNSFTSRIRFEYSILNLYKIGESYEFKINKETDKVLVISNYEFLEFGIPISFKEKENQTTITLEIDDFDLDNNKLKFKNRVYEPVTYEIDYSDFETNKIYNIPILETYINRNDNLFAKIEFKNKVYSVSIPSILKNADLGKTLQVTLGTFKDSNTQTLKLTRYSIVSKLFTIGQEINLVITEQEFNQETGITKWILKDQFNLRHNYYPYNDLTFNNDYNKLNQEDEIKLIVLKITDNGFLTLVNELADWSKNNYLIEDVFEEIGYADKEDEYFFKNKDFLTNDENDIETGNNSSYIDQYNEGENLWVFSYLANLDIEIYTELEKENYERSLSLVDIYIKLEYWILEGSNYLLNFSEFRRPDIIRKAESKIEKLEALAEAINIYLQGEDQKYLEDIKESLARTPYLNQKKKNILKQIINISQYFNSDANSLIYDTIILMIKHGFFEDYERYSYAKSIIEKINRLRDKVLDGFNDEDSEESQINLQSLISNQFLVVILNSYSNENMVASISSINYMRYLAIYNKSIQLLDLAIHLIVHRAYLQPNVYRHNDAFDISYEEFFGMIRYPENQKLMYVKSGMLLFEDNHLKILPNNINKVRSAKKLKDSNKILLDNYQNLNISVLSKFEFDVIHENNSELDNLNTILKILNYKNEVIKPDFIIDGKKIYSGRITSIGIYNEYCFLKLKIEGEEFNTILHINTIHKSRILNNINMFFKMHDKVQFEIVEMKNDRLTISPSILIDEFVSNNLVENSVQTVKVLKKYEDNIYGISEKGWPVIIFNADFDIDDSIEVNIVDYNNEFQNFIGEGAVLSESSFDQDPQELFRNFLIESGVIHKNTNLTKKNENENNEDTEFEEDLGEDELINEITYDVRIRNLGVLLIQCLEQRLFYLNSSVDTIIHYYLIIAISEIIKTDKTDNYKNKLLKLAEIIKLKDNEIQGGILDIDDLNTIDLVNVSDDSGINLIKFFNTKYLEIPLDIHSNDELYMLKKLIESYNLFLKLDSDKEVLEYIKKSIIQQLYISNIPNWNKNNIEFVLKDTYITDDSEKKTEVVITNLGSESKNQEFKTSIFYSASEEPQEKIILKTIAGFLNSYNSGGSLYIGVNDTGDIIGIKNDLLYSKNIQSLDQYQNHIQSLIAAVFPKEINALIDYKFHKTGILDYLEIIIPKYEKPIALDNEFYQRQGVQTRILKGDDVVDFIFRKSNISNNKINQNNSFSSDKESTEIVSFDTDATIDIDFYQDIKNIGLKQEETNSSYSEKILGIMYIFEDSTYMISSNELIDEPYMFKIEISEKHKYGSILMCYDNACINRMEVRSVLNKTFNKKYRNAISSYGNLMAVKPSLPSDEIAIEIKRFDKRYLKIYSINKITEHTIIGLKGNCIVQEDFDQVVKYYHKDKFDRRFESFRRDSRQGLGAELDIKSNLYELLINTKR